MKAPFLLDLPFADWSVRWWLVAAAASAAALYLVAGRRTRRWPLYRSAALVAGIGCVLVSLQSGIATYDERLLSVHMVQHMLLLLVAPLLLHIARPVLLALRALPGPERRALARGLARVRPLSRPWWCLFAFAAIVLGTHIPAFYDATLRHPMLHELEHAAYLFAGLALWWPVLDGDPVPSHRLGGLAKLGYLLASMVPMAVIGAYLNRHDTAVYPAYVAPAHALGVSAVSDQAQAGAIMWVVGNTIMIAVGLWAVVATMVGEERRLAARELRTGAGRAGVPPVEREPLA